MLAISYCGSDCLIHWIAELTKQNALTPENGDALCSHPLVRVLMREAKAVWMQHAATQQNVRTLLSNAIARTNAHGISWVTPLARTLLAQLAYSGGTPLSVLHDNCYGRAFDSFVSDVLVFTPPPEVLQATARVASFLNAALSECAPATLEQISAHTLGLVVREPRFWFPKVPLLARYSTLAGKVDIGGGALLDLLRAPTLNGFDCMAIPYLTVHLLVAIRATDQSIFPWLETTNPDYLRDVVPYKSLLIDVMPDAAECNATQWHEANAGLLLRHHRNPFEASWMAETGRYATKVRPDLSPRCHRFSAGK